MKTNFLSKHWRFYRDLDAAKRANPRFAVPLESLRGLLTFLIFLYHVSCTYFLFQTGQWGDAGPYCLRLFGSGPVTIFFFLTGYLFWRRLIESGSVGNLRRFYKARWKRLFPAYSLTVLLIFIVALSASQFILIESPWQIAGEFLSWLTFGLYRFSEINGFPEPLLIDAGVLWTLRVEAQFYLLLPFLAWFAKGKRIFLLLSATLLLYFLCRNLPTESWSHYTFTVFLKLSLVGFGFGIFTAYCERSARILSWLQSNRFTVIAVAALIALFFIQPDGYSFTESALLWLPFASIAAGGIFAKLLRGPITLFLGGISYSFYLIHGLILFLFSRAIDHQTAFAKLTGGQFFFFVFSSYFLSVAVASVIFRWVEYPFLSDSRAAKN